MYISSRDHRVENGRTSFGCRTIVPVHVQQRTFGQPLLTVPEDHGVESMRFNDGKASPGGKVIIGRMHAKWRDGNPGRLYR